MHNMKSCNGSFKILLLILIIFGIVIPLFIQIILSLQQGTLKDESILASHKILYVDMEARKSQVSSLELHLSELESIKFKALHDLMELDEKRLNLKNDIQRFQNEKDILEKEHRSYTRQVQKLKKQAELARDSGQQKIVQNVIHVGIPKSPQLKKYKQYSNSVSNTGCNFDSCFDYSKCSVLQSFAFHIYKPQTSDSIHLYNTFKKHVDVSKNIKNVCVYIVLISFDRPIKEINKYLISLSSWKNTGYNHLLVITTKDEKNYCHYVDQLERRSAIVITSKRCKSFAHGFDILLPITQAPNISNENIWKLMQPLFPIRKKIFLFFHSQLELNENVSSIVLPDDLKQFNSENDVNIQLDCGGDFMYKCDHGWCSCGPPNTRNTFLKTSTFNLIILENYFFTDIIESFKNGAIPVVLGSYNHLPFSTIIDWTLACIFLPIQRLPELIFILRTMPIADIVALKLQGRFLFETYFATQDRLSNTLLAVFRSNIGLPPGVMEDVKAAFVNDITYSPDAAEYQSSRYASPHLSRNFSYVGKNKYKSWNLYPGGLKMYPVVPWNHPTPSQIQFLEEGKDFYMPIGDGKGGDGVAFARSLGGDYPIEQFTVLLLTYDRESILMEALQRLSAMKYLNKVIVLWNHPVDPPKDLSWPDIGVKIEVIRTGRNSLNNRFIPYDTIETEAILSMDDDIYLRHDEIELAFRVWRENRDRLVGFPGRHHSYNTSSKSFYYNPEHSCELSLVLTGAAFFHKYYSYIYTYNMNPAIREMVDDYMNCEDIAMNFMMAHVTQKPPIKVTSRWTFRCPGCPVALSADSNHYEERNKCMAFFESVYGYNPLKRTQFRADSILFKTRLPSTMTKCFQFV